jgi:hypothetical protein
MPSGTKNSRFSWWVTWDERHQPGRVEGYRDYFVNYLPKKRCLYDSVREWRATSNVVTSRITYHPELKSDGIGFETESEAFMFMLMFYEQITAVEEK